MPASNRSTARLLFAALGVAALAILAWRGPSGPPFAALGFRVAAWTLVTLLPGWSLYRLVERRSASVSEACLAALVLSPVLVALVGILLLLAGLGPMACGRAVVMAAAILSLGALRAGGPLRRPARRHALAALALIGAAIVLTAYLPFTREWWRVRSDAWFHGAVVAQIASFGLPPTDPYFAGIPLQYMWFYHVVILVVSRVVSVDPFWAMAILNVQALAGLGLAAFHFAGVFRARFAHRFAAAATLLFAFNGAFWVLLPVKLLRAFSGDVKGLDEIKRTYALVPFDYGRATGFMTVYFNQEFFLDKFMVATAFGLSLTFMTTAWYAATSFLAGRRSASLLLLAGALVGMLGFHSVVGFVMLVGIFGGTILAYLFRARPAAPRVRDPIVLLAVSLGCFLACVPYLYAVMHLKEHEQIIPLSLSFHKTIGIAVSSAFVLALAFSRRQRHIWVDPDPVKRFFAFAVLSVVAFCLVIRLPGPNTYDKLGFFVFIPLSIVGGFGVADSILARSGARRIAVGLAWTLLFYVPVNAIAVSAGFFTPDEVAVTPDESRLSDWVREHTPREALMIDDGDRVTLLVSAPRQYYWGCVAYAEQWGYPRLEMSRRIHVRRALYSADPLDATTLKTLGAISEPVYVVVRPEHRAAGAVVTRRPELFAPVYDGGALSLVRVDAQACRSAAAGRADTLSTEEIIRESGLQ